MATTYKVLGQNFPTTTSNANLYTVPALTSAIISTLTITNVTTSPATCRVFVRPAAAAAATSNAVLYDVNIAGNSLATFTLGITLATTDIVTVQSSVANTLTFQAFGTEIS
jgi:hypothetical protein